MVPIYCASLALSHTHKLSTLFSLTKPMHIQTLLTSVASQRRALNKHIDSQYASVQLACV